MANKHKEMQYLIRKWKEDTGKLEINMKEVAEYAISQGWPLPPPITPEERLAKEFAKAAREETRTDSVTGRPYRVYHAFPQDGDAQGRLWVDIDEAPRKYMLKSAVMRREQMVGDAVQLTFDLDHWNSKNADEEPIELPMDFEPDVLWRKMGGDAGTNAA
jgi:hypothetical protein